MGTTQRQAHKRPTPPPAQLAFQRRILLGLNMRHGYRSLPHIYAGTVPAKVKAARRAANKRARIARRLNRSR